LYQWECKDVGKWHRKVDIVQITIYTIAGMGEEMAKELCGAGEFKFDIFVSRLFRDLDIWFLIDCF
jgi:hypothetical protein